MRQLAVVMVVSTLHTSGALAQLCPGDSYAGGDAYVLQTGNCQLNASAGFNLNHSSHHTACTGIVRIDGYVGSGCGFGGQNQIATNSGPHSVHRDRTCNYSTTSNYRVSATFRFNSQVVGSDTHTAWATCGGGTPQCNPCAEPGYVPPDQASCAAHLADACGCCPDPSPLLIDLSADGIEMSSAEDGALFDINGRKSMFWLGWPLSADDAWLALDRNNNGLIDDGSELFGNTRMLQSGTNARHGYEVLAELDANSDGVVDTHDPDFGRLVLWGDSNRDGVCAPLELVPVFAAGIRALSLKFVESGEVDKHGNRFALQAPVTSSKPKLNLSTVDVFPIWLKPETSEPQP